MFYFIISKSSPSFFFKKKKILVFLFQNHNFNFVIKWGSCINHVLFNSWVFAKFAYLIKVFTEFVRKNNQVWFFQEINIKTDLLVWFSFHFSIWTNFTNFDIVFKYFKITWNIVEKSRTMDNTWIWISLKIINIFYTLWWSGYQSSFQLFWTIFSGSFFYLD